MTRQRDHAAHILVVDDDQRIRQMLTRYFEQEGYRVSVAADGQAMRAQLNDSVNVILLDVVMPSEDGLTLAREIRASSDVGIIMLTGRGDVLDRIIGLEVGADDYIAKPFHLREVLARVKSVLRRREPPTMPSGTVGRSDPLRGLAPGRCASPARLAYRRRRCAYQRRVRSPGRPSSTSRPRPGPRSADGFDARAELGDFRPHHRRASRPPPEENRSRSEKPTIGQISSKRGLRLHRENRSIV